jgi:hypothetical protein
MVPCGERERERDREREREKERVEKWALTIDWQSGKGRNRDSKQTFPNSPPSKTS